MEKDFVRKQESSFFEQGKPINKDFSDLRCDYQKGVLDETTVSSNPFELFMNWLEEAFSLEKEANAMTLATVSKEGRPSTRVVLLKRFDDQGLVWFTHYTSRKGRELAQNPCAACQFFWPQQERVIRIEGTVQLVPESESEEYFMQRPLRSKQGALASDQSAVIASRDFLEQRFDEIVSSFGDNPPRPDFWGGYRLVPDYWEFWQGRASRLHDRLAYVFEKECARWKLLRLAP